MVLQNIIFTIAHILMRNEAVTDHQSKQENCEARKFWVLSHSSSKKYATRPAPKLCTCVYNIRAYHSDALHMRFSRSSSIRNEKVPYID